jgi:hypothetical protein
MSSQDAVLVEYRRAGGIAGREDHLVVRGDGTARLSRRGATWEFAVPTDTLARLRALVTSRAVARLDGDYLPTRTGADLFEYVIAFDGRRIRTMDTAVPPALEPLIQLLSALANRRP